MSFPRYKRYKDSGVEWLGEVPEHWNLYRSRRLFSQRKERVRDSDEQLTASQKHGIVTQEAFMQAEGRAVVRVIHGAEILKHVEPDDFVISMRSFQGGLEWSGIRGCISSAYVMLAPSEPVYPGFFRYLFKSDLYIQALQTTSNLVRDGQAMRYENFTLIDLPLPPMQEQRDVASFLDHEVKKIEELIEEQRRLVDLLKEKRQAVISHAVNKGLNPDIPMKNSGIEWLGPIPEAWHVLPLKRYLDFLTSGSRGWAEHYSDSGALFVRIGNLTREDICLDFSDLQRVAVSEGAEGSRTKMNAGDILFSITAFLGSVAVVPEFLEDAYVSQHVALARLRGGKLDPRWVAYTTLSLVGKTYLDMQGYGGTKIQLGLDDIANLILVIPPVDEQRLILQWLELELTKYESLRNQANASILLLRERRSALISAAVTGKIDVRAYMAKPALSTTQYSSGFAHQLLAAEILDRCNSQRMGRIKLQKLIHLCEYHGQVSEVQGDYSRKAAGPFDAKAMAGISKNLKKQKWFEEVKEGERYVYRPLEKRGEHKKYLAHWQAEMPRIDEVLSLLGNFKTRECEIVSTLYAAWNDLLIDGGSTDDAAILHEASSAERWHKSKEQIAPDRWKKALQWMKGKGLVPVGYGKHTRHIAGQIGTTTEVAHEPA